MKLDANELEPLLRDARAMLAGLYGALDQHVSKTGAGSDTNLQLRNRLAQLLARIDSALETSAN